MQSRPRTIRTARPPAGFTMLELLIVIGLLGFLTATLLVVLGNTGTEARIQSTNATIRILDSLIQERIQAFNNLDLSAQASRFKDQYDSGSNTPSRVPLQVAELMIRKDRYRAAFPTRIEDLLGLNGADDGGSGDDSPLLNVVLSSPTGANFGDDDTVSSELMYFALTNGAAFGLPNAILDEINPRHIGDTDGDKKLEFLDDWGNPLQFYNWPTRLLRPDGSTLDLTAANVLVSGLPSPSNDPANPLNQDPQDQLGRLRTTFGSGYNLGSDTMQAFNEQNYHTPDTYHTFLIVSAGPDGEFGLDNLDPGRPAIPGGELHLARPNPDVTGTASLDDHPITDNITNRQQR